MTDTKIKVSAFTTKYNGLANAIITSSKVSKNSIDDAESCIDVKAIWDTGATSCAISQEVARRLNLIPISKAEVHTANGVGIQNVYLINLSLPNNVLLNNVVVTEVEEISNADMLIGMSVISKGDFCISNHKGKTTVSFRMPSTSETNYVELLKSRTPASSTKIGRNEPCPCGSGKKYKQCCGK